jgi:cyclase
MRELGSGILLENKYPGVRLGALVTSDGLLLIDSPIRIEDGREWLAALGPRGRARYLAALDYHPDRVLGARGLDLPIVAHDVTRQVMSNWSDTFKGNAAPIGAEADRLKRITGVRKAIPELTFSHEMRIHLGDEEIIMQHRPGPTPGSIWVEVPSHRVIFIGDAVCLDEPPYLGEADLEAWQETLEGLRQRTLRKVTLVSARDGVVGADDIVAMIRFLRKIPGRLERLAAKGQPVEAAAGPARSLLEGFRVPASRRDQALLRLQAGLMRLYDRTYRNVR